MDICRKSQFKAKFTFEKMLEKVCDSFFDSIGESYERFASMIKKGQKVKDEEVNKLMYYENKIIYYLGDKYEAYKAKKNMTKNYQQVFVEQKEQALNVVKANYIDQGKVD